MKDVELVLVDRSAGSTREPPAEPVAEVAIEQCPRRSNTSPVLLNTLSPETLSPGER